MSGWKQWDIGEVVEAGDFQSYVQDQTVQYYADSTARGTALGTAVSEGMVSYTADDNTLAVYDGSRWGQIAQAISPNYIINGAFDIWQRGTSLSGPLTGTPFLADRWACTDASGTANLSQQTFAPGEIEAASFGNAKYFYRMDVTTNAAFTRSETKLEGVDILAGQTATISFWAKGVNPTGGDGLRVYLQQVFGSGGSSTVSSTANFPTLTSSWQRFAYTVTLPSISGKTIGAGAHLKLLFDTNSSDPTAWRLDLWGVQLEAGSVATPFRRNANSIQGELAACQRYYYAHAVGNNQQIGVGHMDTADRAYVAVFYPVEMRTAPTLEVVSSQYLMRSQGLNGTTATMTLASQSTPRSAFLDMTRTGGSALGAGNAMNLWNNTVDCRVSFSAEL